MIRFFFPFIASVSSALLLFSSHANAYPDFIGFGYNACITCHYDGAGGGALNDYGRALWSSEIASRALYPKSISDEQLGAQSGFLGPVNLPYWIRPDIKYRGIQVRTNPGSSTSDRSKFYQMQTDFGLAVQDKKQKYVGVVTVGREIRADQFGTAKSGLDHMFAREYYARVEVVKSLWVYAGLMEKVFGLRNIDHTSFQRVYQSFNVVNNDPNGIAESQGVIVQKVAEKWDVTLNGFAGNPYDDKPYKQKGFSGMTEFSVGENKRLGFSVFSANNDVLKKQMAAIHYRQEFSKGSALMAEWGVIKDTPANQNGMTGSYDLVQALIQMTRGYNIITAVQRYNQEFKSTSPDQWRWEFGFLMFPVPRLELRFEAVNDRQFSSQNAADDAWTLEGQVHVSL